MKIPVANTDWELSYGVNDSSITLDSGVMFGFVILPLMLMAADFLLGYRVLSTMLREDLASLMKVFKG